MIVEGGDLVNERARLRQDKAEDLSLVGDKNQARTQREEKSRTTKRRNFIPLILIQVSSNNQV